MLSVRPRVAELTFQVFGRSLHPELFEVVSSRLIERSGYSVRLEITRAGHVVTWRRQGFTLTEVAAAAEQPLPKRRRLLAYRLAGDRSDHLQCRGGVLYRVRFQVEALEPETSGSLQSELARDRDRHGLVHSFGGGGRLAPGAVSYIHVESRSRTLLVQSLHTFPDDRALVKIQSQFELP